MKMRLTKDTFLNVTYSTFFAIVILAESSSLDSSNSSMISIFKSFFAIGILILWMKVLRRNHSDILFFLGNSAQEKPILAGFKLIKDFLDLKFLFVLVFFCCYTIFTNSFEFEKIGYYFIQTLAVGFYTLSWYLIALVYFKISIDHWLFIFLIYAPYFLLFIIYGIFGFNNMLLFALIPGNINLLFELELSSLFLFGLSTLSFIAMGFLYLKSMSELMNGSKYHTSKASST